MRLSEGQTFDYFPNITLEAPTRCTWSGHDAVRSAEIPLRTQSHPALQTAYEEDRHAVLEPYDLNEEETSAPLSRISASCFTLESMDRSLCTLLRFTRSNGRLLQRMRDGIANYGPVREGVYAMTTSLADVVAPVHQSFSEFHESCFAGVCSHAPGITVVRIWLTQMFGTVCDAFGKWVMIELRSQTL